MDPNRTHQYHSEIFTWLKKQSMFYQFFNSFRIAGFSGAGMSYFLWVLIRLLFVALFVGAVTFLYFARNYNEPAFAQMQADRIERSLHAENVKLSPLKGGTFAPVTISKLTMQGTDKSFFDKLDFYMLKMDFGNIFFKKTGFRTPHIKVNKIETRLKVSATEGAEGMYQSLFAGKSWFNFRSLECASFNCDWGYSTNSKGKIKGANLQLVRNGEECQVVIKGGTLTYSWLKDVKIQSMTLVLTPDSFEIKEAIFRRGDALFSLNLEVLKFGEQPIVQGGGDIINGELKDLLRPEFLPYVTGVIDCSYEFSGSPNSLRGLDYVFTPLMPSDSTPEYPGRQKDPHVEFTYEVPIIKALGAVDRTINYRALSFTDLDWEIELRGGEVYAREIALRHDYDQIEIDLEFALKAPSQDYIVGELQKLQPHEYTVIMQRPWLRQHGIEMMERKKGFGATGNSQSLTYEDYVELLKKELHFYGKADIRLQEESLEGKEILRAEFPSDDYGWRSMEVPLQGHVKTITRDYSNNLYFLSHKVAK